MPPRAGTSGIGTPSTVTPAVPDEVVLAPSRPRPAPRPVPSTGRNPFAELPEALELPPIDTAEMVEVAELGSMASRDVELMLFSAPVPGDEPLRFRLRRESSESPLTWVACAVRDDAELDGATPLARLAIRDEKLKFQWNAREDESPRQFLRNAFLRVTVGGSEKRIALRRPLRLGPLMVKLEKKRNALTLDLPALPDKQLLAFEVARFDGFPRGIGCEPREQRVEMGKNLALQPRASSSISLRLDTVCHTKPVATLSGKYRLGEERSTFDFTLTQLERHEQGLTKSLAKAKTDGPRLVSEAKQLPYALTRAQNMRVTSGSPAEAQQRLARSRAIQRVVSQMRSAQRQIESLERAIPKLEKNISLIGPLRRLADQWHESASIHYRLVLQVADRGKEYPLDLVVGGSPD